MIDGKLLTAIQILALKSVEEPTDEDIYLRICRWFSQTFSTPLPEVEALDPVYVLTHYFQDKFLTQSQGEEKDFMKYEDRKMQLLFPEEYEKKKNKDDNWIKELEAEVASQNAKSNKGAEIIKETVKRAAESIISDTVKQAMDKLNLNGEEFDIPDSGSIGEE